MDALGGSRSTSRWSDVVFQRLWARPFAPNRSMCDDSAGRPGSALRKRRISPQSACAASFEIAGHEHTHNADLEAVEGRVDERAVRLGPRLRSRKLKLCA